MKIDNEDTGAEWEMDKGNHDLRKSRITMHSFISFRRFVWLIEPQDKRKIRCNDFFKLGIFMKKAIAKLKES